MRLEVTEDELQQLRRIDAAARRFVNAFEARTGRQMHVALKVEWEALQRALYEGKQDNGT